MTRKDFSSFSKIVRIGRGRWGDVFAKIEYSADGRLSICGVEGPMRDGNCKGGCGQIEINPEEFAEYAPGWDADKVREFNALWCRWHLNDMTAGSPAQEAFLRANPINDRMNYFTRACEALAAANLHPDPNYTHNGKPYKYGSAWLREEVPAEVLEWLKALPDTDTAPAWV